MGCTEKSVKDQAELLAEARKAGKDALDSILELIPEEEGQPHLTPSFPRQPIFLCSSLLWPDGTLMRPCRTFIPS